MDGPASWRGYFGLSAAAESLRSRVSLEVVTSVAVVLRKVRWLGSWRSLKTRRWVDFELSKTAGGPEFRRLTAVYCCSCKGDFGLSRCIQSNKCRVETVKQQHH